MEAQAEKERVEAERAAGREGEDGEPAPRPKQKRRRANPAAGGEGTGSAAEAVEGELRRNKLSSRINYDIVTLLSQTLDEDVEHMPNAPGPVGSLADVPRTFSEALMRSGAGSSHADDASFTGGGSSHGDVEPAY